MYLTQSLSRADLANARSFGLRGLHERASTVGGWVDISSDGAGTVLMLSVPLPKAEQGQDEDTSFDHDADHDPSAWGAL